MNAIGGTTTTVTAVSSPRARTRIPTPTSEPPTSAGPLRRAPQRVRRPSCLARSSSGRAAGDVRRASRASSREPEPRHVAEQRREAAAGPDLDDGQRPAALVRAAPDRLAHVVSPSPRRGRRAGRGRRGRGLDELLGGRARHRATAEIRTSTASARAYVATIGLVARRSASPRRSATGDSPIPASRSVRVATSAPAPRASEPRQRPGRTRSGASRAAGRAGRRSPGRPGRSTHQPGAVPFAFGRASADGISQACLRLISGIGMPRRDQRPRSHASRSGSTTGVSPSAAAIASRVRSSGVGPRPPVETTRSARSSAAAKASVTASRSSGSAGQPGDRDPERRSGSGRARRRSCRASRRPSARCRCSAAPRSAAAAVGSVMFSQRNAPPADGWPSRGRCYHRSRPRADPTRSTPLDDPNASPDPSTPPPRDHAASDDPPRRPARAA